MDSTRRDRHRAVPAPRARIRRERRGGCLRTASPAGALSAAPRVRGNVGVWAALLGVNAAGWAAIGFGAYGLVQLLG